jgi:hypothetical protein
MDMWSTEQVLAVYDVCQTISAVLMDRYEQDLITQMADNQDRRFPAEQECATTEQNLPLPFDDPF